MKVQNLLEANKWVRHFPDWKVEEIHQLNHHRFITAKKVVYLVNLAEADYVSKKNKWLKKIKDHIDTHGGGDIIPYSAEYEKNNLLVEDEGKRTRKVKEHF